MIGMEAGQVIVGVLQLGVLAGIFFRLGNHTARLRELERRITSKEVAHG